MNNLLIVFTSLATGLVVALTNDNLNNQQFGGNNSDELKHKPQPNSSSTETVFDFPPTIIDETPDWIATVPIVNKTDRLLNFADVRPSCTCSSGRLSTSILEPGREASLTIHANLRGRVGPQAFGVMLNDASGLNWNVVVRTECVERFRVRHNGTTHFRIPDLRPGESASGTLSITAHTTEKGSSVVVEGMTVKAPGVSTFTTTTGEKTPRNGLLAQEYCIHYTITAPDKSGPYLVSVLYSEAVNDRKEERVILLHGDVLP
jgi:hypothetical protein